LDLSILQVYAAIAAEDLARLVVAKIFGLRLDSLIAIWTNTICSFKNGIIPFCRLLWCNTNEKDQSNAMPWPYFQQKSISHTSV